MNAEERGSEMASATAHERTIGRPTPSWSGIGRRRVLIIDDDEAVALTLARAAEECGCPVTLTDTAESFQARYRAESPEIVIIDLALVGTDGVEILKFLAQENSDALVLIASGFDRRVVEAAMRFGGALGLNMGAALTKPILVEDLKCALRNGPL
jgi:ActR/RegA family two-component response regulator